MFVDVYHGIDTRTTDRVGLLIEYAESRSATPAYPLTLPPAYSVLYPLYQFVTNRNFHPS